MQHRLPERSEITSATRCSVCGKPLGDNAIRPKGKGFEHVACHDWSTEPFPFDRHLECLRRDFRRMRWQKDEVAKVGRMLRQIQAAWPSNANAEVVKARQAIRQLAQTLEGLGVDERFLHRLRDGT